MKKFTAYFEERFDGSLHAWVMDDTNHKIIQQVDSKRKLGDVFSDIRRSVSELFSDGPLQRFLPVRKAHITRMFIPMQEAGINEVAEIKIELEKCYTDTNDDIRGTLCPFCNTEITCNNTHAATAFDDHDLEGRCAHVKDWHISTAIFAGPWLEALDGQLI